MKKNLKIKLVAGAMGTLTMMALGSGVAGAVTDDELAMDRSAAKMSKTVYAPDDAGYATVYGRNVATGYKVSGTIYDTEPDGACVRVYTQGYDTFTGWGPKHYVAQACGNGDHEGYSDTKTLQHSKVLVWACKGMPRSDWSNCNYKTFV